MTTTFWGEPSWVKLKAHKDGTQQDLCPEVNLLPYKFKVGINERKVSISPKEILTQTTWAFQWPSVKL